MSEQTIYGADPSQVRDHAKYAQAVVQGLSAASNILEMFRKCWMMDEKASIEMACEILRAEHNEEALKEGLKREEDPNITTAVAKKTKAKLGRRNVMVRQYPPMPCNVCGTIYTPIRATQKSCGRKCRELSRQAERNGLNPADMRVKLENPSGGVVAGLKPIACEQCANEFTPTTRHQKYCSHRCNRKARTLSRDEFLGKERVCRECGSGFTVEDVNRLYHCSKDCFRKYKTRLKHESAARKKGLTYEEYIEKIGTLT